MLATGADPEILYGTGHYAFDIAVQEESLNALKVMLKHLVPLKGSMEGKYADLHRAVAGNSHKAVELLIRKGAKVNVQSIPHQNTPLHIAATNNNIPIIKMLANAKANINAQNKKLATPFAYSRLDESL